VKQFIIHLSLILFATGLMAQIAVAPVAGDGTIYNPYEIATLENLYWIAASDTVVPEPDRAARWSASYKQIADIDASETVDWFGGEGWIPIGLFYDNGHPDNLPYSGNYSGRGHKIEGLYINQPNTVAVGLFGYLNQAEIDGLGVIDTYITGNIGVGALAAYISNSEVFHSCSTGSVNSTDAWVGGLVGYQEFSTISYSYSAADVSGAENVGGLTGGSAESIIYNCYSTGDVATLNDYAGGLVAFSNGSEIHYSYSRGSVSGNASIGGLVGHTSGVVVDVSNYWDIEVSGQTGSAMGEGRTTEEMTFPTDYNTYIDWDFENVWTHDVAYWENEGYPYFRWQWYIPEAEPPLAGTGIVTDPYEIETLGNLYWIAEDPDRWVHHYIQTADIDASDTVNWYGGMGWRAIGFRIRTLEFPFTGSYNGQDHIINGLHINHYFQDDVGLFGLLSSATISNLGLINVNITGHLRVGGLVGLSDEQSLVTGCYSRGIVNGQTMVGGLVGSNYNSTISNSYSSGSVNGDDLLGGLVGLQYLGNIENSYSTSDVSGEELLGGLIGATVSSSNISECYSTGNVSGTEVYVGGLAGSNEYSVISKSYSTGSVIGHGAVGGLVGSNEFSVVTDSYSTGSVEAFAFVGGLIGGNIEGAITHCYSIGPVIGSADTGGLVGYVETGPTYEDTNNYWNTETSGQGSSEMGEGRTTVEMIYPYAANTYVDWDFAEIWSVDETHEANDGYPYLTDVTLSVEDDVVEVVERNRLYNYPNPFNPETTISFSLQSAGEVSLEIYNIRWQRVKTLLSGYRKAGEHAVVWDGKNDLGRSVSSGIYFYRMINPEYEKVRKMLLLK